MIRSGQDSQVGFVFLWLSTGLCPSVVNLETCLVVDFPTRKDCLGSFLPLASLVSCLDGLHYDRPYLKGFSGVF